ncbi:MAG: hypothetical protein ACLTLQ_09090 [[Clostridium] scindens]
MKADLLISPLAHITPPVARSRAWKKCWERAGVFVIHLPVAAMDAGRF